MFRGQRRGARFPPIPVAFRADRIALIGLIGLLGVIGLLALDACARPEAVRPPDVVILLADDLGWADVGYHGVGPNVKSPIATPEIDRLARAGLRLERYCTAPLCTPARAGLLTGRSPLRLGLRRNLLPFDRGSLPLDEELLPAAFGRAGYQTAMVGKWHLGHAEPEQRPNARGFESFYGFLSGWIDYSTHEREGFPDWWRDGEPIRETGYATSLFSKEAVSILSDEARTRPLFLYVAFNAPHPPVHVPPGRTLDAATASAITWERHRGAYALMVAELDRAVGEILGAIERGPRAQETIVFFASDNGADPPWGGRNEPLREGKYEVFEGGIRSPAILWWPGHVPPRETRSLVTHQDVLPTVAGLAGIELAPKRPLDGRNLGPELVAGAIAEHEPVAFGVEDGPDRAFALVGERWKFVEAASGDAVTSYLLFDVTADPEEGRNLASEDPGRFDAMRTLLEPWMAMPLSLPKAARQRRGL